ncbi:hypothetical protein TCAL_14795 [Tigriopus californicus]|uniref:Uncharacterized protein n=1 Tax=Tigriopus californicus TaxID=6832 RepID=A0A553PNL9_TIGCA|nr:hypothetical protein TCAL_14795 [Tigriopus californicus]
MHPSLTLPVLALQSSNAVSLPANIDNLSDEDEDDEEDEDLDEDLGSEHIHNHLGHFAHDSTSHPKLNGRSSLQGGHERASNPTTPVRRGNKLKRRKAYYTRQRSDITTNPVGPTWSLPLDAFFDAQYQFSLAKASVNPKDILFFPSSRFQIQAIIESLWNPMSLLMNW